MELRRYIAIMNRYRLTLLIVPLVAALVALAASFAISSRYSATATVQLILDEFDPRTITLRSEQGPGQIALGLRDPTEILAQGVIETLRSREVAQAIVSELGVRPDAPPEGLQALKGWVLDRVSDTWAFAQYGYVSRGDPAESPIAAIQGSLSAQLVRGTYHLRITATWRDPGTAAAVANAAVRAVAARSRVVASATAAERRVFLEGQVRDARGRTDVARDALVQYSRVNNAVLSDSVRLQLVEIESAREKVRQNEFALIDARSSRTEAESQLKSTPQSVTSFQSSTSKSNDESSTTTSNITTQNPLYVVLRERVDKLRQDVASLEASGTEAIAQLRAREEQLRGVLVHDSKLAGLNQDVTLASEVYARLTTELYNARLDEARPVSLIRAVAPATAPPYPTQPVKILWTLMGAIAGLTVALLWVLLRHATDMALRTKADLEAVMRDLSLLAVVPRTYVEDRGRTGDVAETSAAAR